MGVKFNEGQRVRVTIEGILSCDAGQYVDVTSDDGRAHSFEDLQESEVEFLSKKVYPGEVWKTQNDKLWFVREWRGWDSNPDHLKVIPSHDAGVSFSVKEFFEHYPSAEVVFSP